MAGLTCGYGYGVLRDHHREPAVALAAIAVLLGGCGGEDDTAPTGAAAPQAAPRLSSLAPAAPLRSTYSLGGRTLRVDSLVQPVGVLDLGAWRAPSCRRGSACSA